MESIFSDIWRSLVSPPSVVYDAERYNPSVKDVFEVKNYLHSIAFFPLEIIDAVIDLAEYWPHTTVTSSPKRVLSGPDENQFILRSFPLGFTPTSDSDYQLLRGDGSSYKSAKPRRKPTYGPPQVPQDLSEQAINKLKSKFQPRGDHPCRKIVFTIKSRDQGWGGQSAHRGTYTGSFTWFDFGLEKLCAFHEKDAELAPSPRFHLAETSSKEAGRSNPAGSASTPVVYGLRTVLPQTITKEKSKTGETSYHFEYPLLPDDGMVLQKNMTSDRNMKEHVITWSCDDNIDPESLDADELAQKGRGSATGSGEMVRNLEVGDVITVWAKARFPGWTNEVNMIKIDVYWAV